MNKTVDTLLVPKNKSARLKLIRHALYKGLTLSITIYNLKRKAGLLRTAACLATSAEARLCSTSKKMPASWICVGAFISGSQGVILSMASYSPFLKGWAHSEKRACVYLIIPGVPASSYPPFSATVVTPDIALVSTSDCYYLKSLPSLSTLIWFWGCCCVSLPRELLSLELLCV